MEERRRRANEKDMSTLLAPASPTVLSDTVADRLRDTIFQGHFAPGERLREESLAEALDVSRGPIRDALLQLEREGLVVRRRNRGAMVAQLSRTDLDEVYSLRIAIEPLVCAWAARNATEPDWAEMQATIDTYTELDESVTVHEAADADLRFHDVVYRASRHKRVLRLWQDLRPQVYIFMLARTYVGEPEFPTIMIRNHGELLGDQGRRREAGASGRGRSRPDVLPARHRRLRRDAGRQMTPARRRIVVTTVGARYSRDVLASLEPDGAELVERYDLGDADDGPGLASGLEGAWGVVAGGEPYTDEVFRRVGGLRAIVRFGVGYERVDVDAASANGVAVCTVPGANADAVADLAVALMLACKRRLLELDAAVRDGTWRPAWHRGRPRARDGRDRRSRRDRQGRRPAAAGLRLPPARG